MRPQVLVVFDGRNVVEDETALQRIPVGRGGYNAHDHRRQPKRKGRPVGHRLAETRATSAKQVLFTPTVQT